jgi:hypothetical protein
MHPLVSTEVADLDLLRALNRGMTPLAGLLSVLSQAGVEAYL